MYEDWQIQRLIERLKESKRFTFHIFTSYIDVEEGKKMVCQLNTQGRIVRTLHPDQREALIDSWLWATVLGFRSRRGFMVLVVSETLPADIMQSEINLINGDVITPNCGKEEIK